FVALVNCLVTNKVVKFNLLVLHCIWKCLNKRLKR
ncbi:transcription-repair coupling factor, partial [Vibrio parahaemolyticus V-223/04]